jgi:tRNA(fMet)-specific endonuclease VapC
LKGHLIDTNHVGAIARNEPKVMARVHSFPPENFPRICAITLGEIEAGNLITASTDQLKRDAFVNYVYEWFLPRCISIRHTTRQAYAEIIGKILKNHPMTQKSQKTERHLVENVGVDINDVWIAAVALEKNMILVTHDKMEKIREVIEPDLEFDDWLK